MTREHALKLMKECGFEAYKSPGHIGYIYAINCERFALKETEFFDRLYMLMDAAIVDGIKLDRQEYERAHVVRAEKSA